MAAAGTVTAKTGPGYTVTAVPLTGITGIGIDVDRKVITFFLGGLASDRSGPYKEFEMTGNTFTVTIASGAISAVVLS